MAQQGAASTVELEYVPGTVHLVDLEHRIHARHAKGKNEELVLVPAPSSDPDDPLNWAPRRKLLFLLVLCIAYIIPVGVASAAIYAILVPMSHATNLTISDLNTGTGYMFLFFGWGCLFWQPVALKFGKRPVYLISTLATTAIMVWAPYTKNNGQWIANKCLQGFFGSIIESLCEISVSDVYFAHERGKYIGIYALFLSSSNSIAPLIGGFINQTQGWKWLMYWCAIFNGVGFLVIFFLMEETNYQRKPTLAVQHDFENVEFPGQTNTLTTSADPEKKITSSFGTSEICHGSCEPHKTKSYIQKLKLFRREDMGGKIAVKGIVLRPFIFMTFPVVLFCGFMYGSMLCYVNVLNGTASLILSAPPYKFKSSSVGLTYIGKIIGAIVGSYLTGPLSDTLVLYLTRRNNGIMEPEFRLWLFGLPMVFVPVSQILWGLGAAHHIHWFGLVFSMSLLAASLAMGATLTISYCIDSYKEISGEAMVTIMLIRNTMSFAIGYGVTPWVTNMGYQNAFITCAFAALAQMSISLIQIKWGKALRKASIPRYLKYVKQIKDEGGLH